MNYVCLRMTPVLSRRGTQIFCTDVICDVKMSCIYGVTIKNLKFNMGLQNIENIQLDKI